VVEKQATSKDVATDEENIKPYILSLLNAQIKETAPQPVSVSAAITPPPPTPSTPPQVANSLLQQILKKAK